MSLCIGSFVITANEMNIFMINVQLFYLIQGF